MSKEKGLWKQLDAKHKAVYVNDPTKVIEMGMDPVLEKDCDLTFTFKVRGLIDRLGKFNPKRRIFLQKYMSNKYLSEERYNQIHKLLETKDKENVNLAEKLIERYERSN